jgi:flagellar biosynthetic protein FlhB
MAEQFGDKSHEATPYRRQKAREEGQVAQSQDLSSALLLVGALLVLMYFGQRLAHFSLGLAREQLGSAAWLRTDPQTVAVTWNALLVRLAAAVLPIFGLLLVLAIVTHVGQTGWLFLPQKLAFDLTRVDPLKGMQRLLSLTNAVRLGFGIFKVVVVSAVAAWCVWANYEDLLALSLLPVREMTIWSIELLLHTSLKIGLALLILAVFDYAYQRWKYERDLRMTPQEIREEFKMLQGDPHIVARRRQVQRQLVLNRLQTAVPKADVVVTNPTELAVAIQYDPTTMEAPIVVAKGAGVLAQQIRRLALAHNIPVIERKPLAQALYHHVDLNKPIPAAQYAAVAEILRYVYQLKGKSLPGQQAA